ncbi:MAG: hypothetical protein LBQ05_01310 [Christensenellaceae bacterium]|jgi:hypothetical protein|nr:hypothetical protein [Christensenellaceae bacterium]
MENIVKKESKAEQETAMQVAAEQSAPPIGANAVLPVIPTTDMPKKRNLLKRIFGTKKGWVGVIVVGLAAILSVVGLLHFKKQSNYQVALGNIAEARYYMKAADSEIAKVQLYSGTREDPYQQDGIAHTNKAFTVVSVEPINEEIAKMVEIPAEITIDNVVTPITLTKNPYGNNFAVDLERLVENTSVVSVSLKIDDANPINFELTNVMPENAITWEQALEIATDAIDDQIDTTKSLETYVKVICDKQTVNTPYWYVTFASEGDKTLFVIIDANGKVVGKSK